MQLFTDILGAFGEIEFLNVMHAQWQQIVDDESNIISLSLLILQWTDLKFTEFYLKNFYCNYYSEHIFYLDRVMRLF